MLALALMSALMLALTLVIVASVSKKCGDEPNFCEKRAARKSDKVIQWVLIPSVKKKTNPRTFPVFKYELRTDLLFHSLKKFGNEFR